MRRFILGWKKRGHDARYGAVVVNYDDDLVICCRRDAEKALESMREIMEKLGLTVNEEKTKVVHMVKGVNNPEARFVFLGYEFRNLCSWKEGKLYIGARPARKSLKRLTERIHALTAARTGNKGTSEVAGL
jgi:hypothetical protein